MSSSKNTEALTEKTGHFTVGMTAMIAAALAMSISPSLVRLADIGPFATAFWRVFLALPILWIWMRQEEAGMAGEFSTKRFALPTILAGLAFAGDLFFWHLSILKTTIANATFFATMAPLWVVIFGWLLFRQKVTNRVLLGLALCIFGGGMLVAESLSFRPDHALGDAYGTITGMFFGLYFLAVGAARNTGASASRVTFELSLITSASLFVVALLLEDSLLPASFNGWLVLLALAFISHAGGQGLLSVALGRLPTTFSSLVIFIEAVAAAILAWIIFGEALSLFQIVGGTIILYGIWAARPNK